MRGKRKKEEKKVRNEGETHRMTVCMIAHRMTMHETVCGTVHKTVFGTVNGREREFSTGVKEKTSLERRVNVKCEE